MFEIVPKHKFLIGIDSDGCAFDTMELKHKECFIPNIIKHYRLQAVSKYAREAAEFVNLYSKSRGINRFPALIETLEWLQKRRAVADRGVTITLPQGLLDWLKHQKETKGALGNDTLKPAVEASGNPDLVQALEWSIAVNETIAAMVEGVPPFPFVRECLERLQTEADMLVCSATPNAALQAEWEEHDIAKYVAAICGQETGTKEATLRNASKYAANHCLMIGDAPGDFKAAQANNVLFYPINPDQEEASWRRLFEEGIGRFLGGTFAGDYQQQLLAEFDRVLPAQPKWPDLAR